MKGQSIIMSKLFLLPTAKQEPMLSEKIPYGIQSINAQSIWESTNKGSGRVVAVIDTGCDISHPDLSEAIIDRYNFTSDDNGNPYHVTDYIGHGTHVAGIIGARENRNGIIGVAPLCKLLVLKVIDRNGIGSFDNLVKALDYILNWKGPHNETVSVINISLGGDRDNDLLHKKLIELNSKGILTIAASGNNGDNNSNTNEVLFPAYYKEVLQIGAVNRNREIMPFSNSNNNIDFVAPGEKIFSTYLNGTYKELTGTSMAAPHISGLVALILNVLDTQEPETINAKVYMYLTKNSEPLGYSLNCEGNGFVKIRSQVGQC